MTICSITVAISSSNCAYNAADADADVDADADAGHPLGRSITMKLMGLLGICFTRTLCVQHTLCVAQGSFQFPV
jgi:hypothetical protein